jgi:hypothetical protein
MDATAGAPAEAVPSLRLPHAAASAESRQNRRQRAFAIKLLRAFHRADVYAQERLGQRRRHGTRPSPLSSAPSLSTLLHMGSSIHTRSFHHTERNKELLRRVHESCIQEPIEDLCELLGVPEESEDRVADALNGHVGESRTGVCATSVIVVLEQIEANFTLISRSLSRSESDRNWVADYSPDWKTRNLVWTLVQSLGRVVPPDDCAKAFKCVKASVFTTLFTGDFILQQRKNARFRETLKRHIPLPGAWDANVGWLAISFFVSTMLASTIDSYRRNHLLSAYWTVFAIIFVVTSAVTVLYYAAYTSWYATRLLDSAAARVPDTCDALSVNRAEAGQVGVLLDDARNMPSSAGTGRESEDDGSDNTDSLLCLYQVSMLVERLHSSYYFETSMLIGLSASQVYSAIDVILTSDCLLGMQFAGFSFTAIAISSRGITLGQVEIDPAAKFSFGLFGLLSAAGFICALTSAVLSDLMRRQLNLTQTKEENRGHGFASYFGGFLRLNGGLNGFAGMFLATAVRGARRRG